MRKRISPDDWAVILPGVRDGRTCFVKISRKRYVRAVKGCNFLLPVDAADGRLNHQKLSGAGVPFEFNTAHPYKGDLPEEPFGQKLKKRVRVRGRSAARRNADIRWPDAQLAAGKRTHSSP